MSTDLTVIVPDCENREHTISAAESVILRSDDHNDFYYKLIERVPEVDGTELATVVPLDSEDGRALADHQIERTVDEKARFVEKVVDAADGGEDVEGAAQSYDVTRWGREIGCWRSTSAYLYDGTSWSRSQPVLNHERLAEIEEHAEDTDLALVTFTGKY